MATGFLVVGLNPTIQNTFILSSLRVSQVNRVIRHRVDAAGKGGNTARVLSQLGERAVHLTFGGGQKMDLYRRLCAEEGVELRWVDCDVDIRHCHTLIGEEDRSITEIVEPGYPVTAEIERSILMLFESELHQAHTVIIGGSRAPGFSAGLYGAMVRKASDAGVRTVLDITGDDLRDCIRHRPTAIKINLSEFSHTFTPDAMLDEEVHPDDIPQKILDRMIRLRDETGTEIVLTNGSRPVLFVADGTVHSVQPERVSPVNTIGSGDAATAGLAAGLRRGLPIAEAVRLAMDCAARNVELEKPGSIR